MGLLDDFTEYARRSGRNLGGLFDYLGDTAAANNQAIKAGAEAVGLLAKGAELTPEQRDALHASPIGGFGTDAGGGGAMALMYLGKNAKAVPQRALTNAQKAAAKGMDNEAIRQKYGWFQDPTGDWKYEISDHKAQLKQNPDGTYKLDHAELRRNYPDLVDSLRIEGMPDANALGLPTNTAGAYYPDQNLIRINDKALADPDQARRVVLHEVQHPIQELEGHSPGTSQHSPEMAYLERTEYDAAVANIEAAWKKLTDDRRAWFDANPKGTAEEYDKLNPSFNDEYRRLAKARHSFPDRNQWAFQKYNAAMGELEARDTMDRRNLTPDQRKAEPPYQGQGVPPDLIWDVRKVADQMKPWEPPGGIVPLNLRGLLNE
jgi:hypothetical protein